MRLVDVTEEDRRALDAVLRTTKRAREWRRLQAVRLLADGREAPDVARALGCSASSVYYWANDWREAGLAGLAEGPHDGRPRQLDGATEAMLAQLLTDDPHAYGYGASDWTVPLLRTELARRGHALSERTLRRTLHRLGFRWKRPKYVLGRPDPAYEAKKGRWSSKRSRCWRVAARSGLAMRRRCASFRRCGRAGPGEARSGWWSLLGVTAGR